jgi:hypothetical protein
MHRPGRGHGSLLPTTILRPTGMCLSACGHSLTRREDVPNFQDRVLDWIVHAHAYLDCRSGAAPQQLLLARIVRAIFDLV